MIAGNPHVQSRRRVIAAIGGATAMALTGQVSAAAKLPTIGFLAAAGRKAHVADLESLREGLAEAGLVEGTSVAIEARYAEGDRSKVDSLIEELIHLGTDVFLVPGPAAARAVKKHTHKPIVAVALPYSNRHPDLFAALGKPGGTITGFSLGSETLSGKRIQLLREAVPTITRLAVLHNGTDPIYSEWGLETEAAAKSQGLGASRLELNAPDPAEIDRLIRQSAAEGAQGLIVIRDFLTATMSEQIAKDALAQKIAALSELRDFCLAGGLMSYGANVPDLFRRSAAYIAKILGGADPAVLPIQIPEKFDLVVNLKTAEALGFDIPPDTLVQATEVIE